jgi:hypothetical protein
MRVMRSRVLARHLCSQAVIWVYLCRLTTISSGFCGSTSNWSILKGPDFTCWVTLIAPLGYLLINSGKGPVSESRPQIAGLLPFLKL